MLSVSYRIFSSIALSNTYISCHITFHIQCSGIKFELPIQVESNCWLRENLITDIFHISDFQYMGDSNEPENRLLPVCI